jgi:hypothetical protein
MKCCADRSKVEYANSTMTADGPWTAPLVIDGRRLTGVNITKKQLVWDINFAVKLFAVTTGERRSDPAAWKERYFICACHLVEDILEPGLRTGYRLITGQLPVTPAQRAAIMVPTTPLPMERSVDRSPAAAQRVAEDEALAAAQAKAAEETAAATAAAAAAAAVEEAAADADFEQELRWVRLVFCWRGAHYFYNFNK